MRTMITLIIPLVCGVTGCMDGEKNSSETADTLGTVTCAAAEDTSSVAYQTTYNDCYEMVSWWAGGLPYGWSHCDVDGDGDAESNSDYPTVCMEEYWFELVDDCVATILCSDDPETALDTLNEACGYGHELVYERADTDNSACWTWGLATPTDECGGAPIVSGGYTFTQSITYWCPCLLTGEYGRNPNYSNTVTCL